jgi:hypothetical protein
MVTTRRMAELIAAIVSGRKVATVVTAPEEATFWHKVEADIAAMPDGAIIDPPQDVEV